MIDKEIVEKVWTKAFAQLNYDSEHIRKDRCGALKVFEEYRNRDSKYGWEIDHIILVYKGGTDDMSNLQPLHWDNNVAKGGGELVYKVKANGQYNQINPLWNILLE